MTKKKQDVIPMTFAQLAQEADARIDAEFKMIEEKDADLSARESRLASRVADLDARETAITGKEKQLQAREEEVVRRELNARRDEEVQGDVARAEALSKKSENDLKKAQELRDEAKMMLEDLEKRELALTEKEKTYREEIKKQISTKMLGI